MKRGQNLHLCTRIIMCKFDQNAFINVVPQGSGRGQYTKKIFSLTKFHQNWIINVDFSVLLPI